MTDFHRTNVDDASFIRGAARILVAPMAQAFPEKIEDVIDLGEFTTEAGVNEKQTVQVKAKKGKFKLTFAGQQTAAIKYNATEEEVKAALEALSNIGVGDVAVTGGPGDETGSAPYVVEFKGQYAAEDVETMTADVTELEEGTKTVTIATEVAGKEAKTLLATPPTFDAQEEWEDLGATKTGIQITINNAEESFDIDQVMGDIASAPTSWECSVGTQLAEFTPEKMQIAWEGSAITVDTTPDAGPEKEIGFGQPVSYTQRRLAVLFQRPNGKIRGYFFRKVQRSPQESSIAHAKTGEQISIPVRFKCLADTSVTEVLKRFFIIRDQMAA
jgi:hypothetical protein